MLLELANKWMKRTDRSGEWFMLGPRMADISLKDVTDKICLAGPCPIQMAHEGALHTGHIGLLERIDTGELLRVRR